MELVTPRAVALWLHLAGVVVWLGAIAHYLLILRPSVTASGMERSQWYLLLRALKRRLRWVIGGAALVVVASGVYLADVRGLLRWDVWEAGRAGRVFGVKMGIVLVLLAVYATALPLIERIRMPLTRGRVFVWTHMLALGLGAVAAYLGLLIHG
jgi:uncharacterized membrane protein